MELIEYTEYEEIKKEYNDFINHYNRLLPIKGVSYKSINNYYILPFNFDYHIINLILYLLEDIQDITNIDGIMYDEEYKIIIIWGIYENINKSINYINYITYNYLINMIIDNQQILNTSYNWMYEYNKIYNISNIEYKWLCNNIIE